MDAASWQDFENLDIRVGTVLTAQPFLKAKKPAYQLTVDFGKEIGIKKTSAQLTAQYTPEQLVSEQVIAIINFPPKNIAGFLSECLVLGIYDENNEVVLLKPQTAVSNGLKIG